jgi:hypothetical protein
MVFLWGVQDLTTNLKTCCGDSGVVHNNFSSRKNPAIASTIEAARRESHQQPHESPRPPTGVVFCFNVLEIETLKFMSVH